jgi:serine/threonine-protein kinase
MADDVLFAGQVISGRFRLRRLLGQGGMGRVWLAEHLALGTDIAVKFLDPRLSSRDDIRARFASEATAAARIQSPHVVTIHDSGFTEQELGFIAMELLRGEDLGRRLARETTLSPALTTSIISQTCRGLGKAHAMSIIHRDVKPENLFLCDDDAEPWVKVLDFGIAKSLAPGGATPKTDTGQILGTPLYMSPEQALGRALDVRSDLYSLAVVAYRCLTGRTPFVCSATGELIVAVSTQVPPTASSFNPAIGFALDAWFSSMLSKDPDARCAQSARDLAESFAAACEGVAPAVGARLGLAPTLHGADTPTLPERSLAREELAGSPTDAAMSSALVPTPHPRRRPLALGAIALAAALVIATSRSWLSPASLAPASSVTPQSAPLAEATTAVTAPLQPAAAATKALAALRLGASPPEATLWLDGQRLPGNPYSGAHAVDSAPHRLRAEAPGYVTEERPIALDRDLELTLALRPVPAETVPSSPPSDGAGAAEASPLPRARRAPPGGAPAKKAASPAPVAPALPPAPAAAPARAPSPSPRGDLELDRGDPWKPR